MQHGGQCDVAVGSDGQLGPMCMTLFSAGNACTGRGDGGAGRSDSDASGARLRALPWYYCLVKRGEH